MKYNNKKMSFKLKLSSHYGVRIMEITYKKFGDKHFYLEEDFVIYDSKSSVEITMKSKSYNIEEIVNSCENLGGAL